MYLLISFLYFRYISILHQAQYTRLYTHRTTAIMLGVCWMYGFILTIPTVFGWGGVDYRSAAALCCYDHTASLSHLVVMSVLAIYTPLCVTFSVYGKIAWTVYKSKKRVAAHGSSKRSLSQVRMRCNIWYFCMIKNM